jgi:hypothetical protein
MDKYTSSAVTSGLNRETNSALVFEFFTTTGKEGELRAPMSGCLRRFVYLYVTVWKPSPSTRDEDPWGKVPVTAVVLPLFSEFL